MEVQVSLSASGELFYRGVKGGRLSHSEYRPVFFTKCIDYARQYGPDVITAHLNVKRYFDTRIDRRAVDIYNNGFLRSGLAHKESKPIKLGLPVAANDADELWSYLAVPEYAGPKYDGIIVWEGDLAFAGQAFDTARVSYVPISINQIVTVSISK